MGAPMPIMDDAPHAPSHATRRIGESAPALDVLWVRVRTTHPTRAADDAAALAVVEALVAAAGRVATSDNELNHLALVAAWRALCAWTPGEWADGQEVQS